jgi:hypothetical protein
MIDDNLLPCASRYGRGQQAQLDACLAPLSRHIHKVGRIVVVRGAPALC